MMTCRKILGVLSLLTATGLSSNVDAAQVFGLYANGTMAPLSGKVTRSMTDELPAQTTASVPVNLTTVVEDATSGSPVQAVQPGESVVLDLYFDEISTWPIDFSVLLGQPLTLTYRTIGDYKLQYQFQHTIDSSDTNLIGLGIVETVPSDAPAGKFAFLGKMTTPVATLTANRSWSVYPIQ